MTDVMDPPQVSTPVLDDELRRLVAIYGADRVRARVYAIRCEAVRSGAHLAGVRR